MLLRASWAHPNPRFLSFKFPLSPFLGSRLISPLSSLTQVRIKIPTGFPQAIGCAPLSDLFYVGNRGSRESNQVSWKKKRRGAIRQIVTRFVAAMEPLKKSDTFELSSSDYKEGRKHKTQKALHCNMGPYTRFGAPQCKRIFHLRRCTEM